MLRKMVSQRPSIVLASLLCMHVMSPSKFCHNLDMIENHGYNNDDVGSRWNTEHLLSYMSTGGYVSSGFGMQ